MKTVLILFTLMALLFSGCIALEKNPANQSIQAIQQPRICFENKKCVEVELAKTFAEQEKGLMYRASLDENSGMLFVLAEEKIPVFWMKNMKIPLDIVWINSKFEIADVSKNIRPCNAEQCELYSPKIPAKYVLEVNAGFFEKNGLKIRENVEFKNVAN